MKVWMLQRPEHDTLVARPARQWSLQITEQMSCELDCNPCFADSFRATNEIRMSSSAARNGCRELNARVCVA